MSGHAKENNFDERAILGAAMDVAASVGWDKCSLSDIAAAAGVEITVLRQAHRDKVGILHALAAHIDSEALDETDSGDETDIPIRERLLEALMLRFDAMEPYKGGIASVARSAIANPRLALPGGVALSRSMRATLASVGISTSGPLGLVRTKAIVLIFLDAMRIWIDDDSPDLSATMRRLDERLGQAEELALSLGIAKSSRQA